MSNNILLKHQLACVGNPSFSFFVKLQSQLLKFMLWKQQQHLFERGINEEFYTRRGRYRTHTYTETLTKYKCHTHSLCESNKIYLDYYSHNGKYTCAQVSSRTLISIKQTQEDNSSIFPNNQIMLYNKYNKSLSF